MTPFHQLARISAERMLNGVVEGMAIALFTGLMLQIMGRQSNARQSKGPQTTNRRNSSTRFAILLSALFSIAALPVLSVSRASGASSSAEPAVWAVPSLWATYMVLAWAAIAAVGLLRVALGLWQLRTVRAGSQAINPAHLDPLLQETLAGFRSSRKVQIASSEKLLVPAAIGFLHPMIVLPEWTLKELSTPELNSILIHELAHLERRDDWTNLAQKILRALLFFHPAVWWVERQLSLEREMACDDVVLSRTANPRAYAECLVTVAERSFMRRGLALAQAAVSKMRQTTLRVSQILDGNPSSSTRVWKPALALLTVASGVFVVGLARAPQLVAFRDSTPAIVSPLATLALPAAMPTAPVAPAAARAVLASFRPKRTAPVRNVFAKAMDANFLQPQPAGSSPAQAIAVSEKQATPPQTLLLFMRAEQFGPSGISWTIRVWRFTVLKPEQVPVGLKLPAKST